MIIVRFIKDTKKHDGVNKAVKFYKKKYKTNSVMANVDSMTTRTKWKKIYRNGEYVDNEKVIVQGYKVTFLIDK